MPAEPTLQQVLDATMSGFSRLTETLLAHEAQQRREIIRIDHEIERLDGKLNNVGAMGQKLDRLSEAVMRVIRLYDGSEDGDRKPLETRLSLLESRVADHHRLVSFLAGVVVIEIIGAIVAAGFYLMK